MGYENTLFNGKSMRNAIITKLSEDKHLTSALFANSNITILIDIISYMYQCLMSNLRQAASESMWSDTMFFENAARLAKMIGYYAKGQMPYTLLAKVAPENGNDTNIILPKFANVNLSYGPYDYMFAVVETNVNKDQSLVRLALGKWKNYESKTFKSDGSKFQEFILENSKDGSELISQKYVHVFVNDVEWTYTPNPLFLSLNSEYLDLDDHGTMSSRSTMVTDVDSHKYNFYINENGDYVLKFGDGLSTAIPPADSVITIKYVAITETDKTITSTIKNAIVNAPASPLIDAFPAEDAQNGEEKPVILCTPLTIMSGYKDIDDVELLKKNSAEAFSRQNRLVTKSDYQSYILENNLNWKDVVIQNNWEFVSSFYGWLYAIELRQSDSGDKRKIIDENNLQMFQSPDLADANNVYIWVLDKNTVDSNSQVDYQSVENGIIEDLESGSEYNLQVGAMKDITIHPVFLNAVCKRFAPCAIKLSEITGLIDYSNRNPFKKYKSYFRIHVDSDYSNSLNTIKSRTYQYIKSYLFDNIKLGVTPNISALIKDLMSIDGVINITTVFNDISDGGISSEYETNGMRFCTWTDTYNTYVYASEDVDVSYNLPNIPCFQYLKSILSFSEFIKDSLQFKLDYSIKA